MTKSHPANTAPNATVASTPRLSEGGARMGERGVHGYSQPAARRLTRR
jgi:hypothetical protein